MTILLALCHLCFSPKDLSEAPMSSKPATLSVVLQQSTNGINCDCSHAAANPNITATACAATPFIQHQQREENKAQINP